MSKPTADGTGFAEPGHADDHWRARKLLQWLECVTALEQHSNDALAALLVEHLWADVPLGTPLSDLVAEVTPRLTDQAGKMHLLLAYLLDHAAPADIDSLHVWLTEQTARLHQKENTPHA